MELAREKERERRMMREGEEPGEPTLGLLWGSFTGTCADVDRNTEGFESEV